MQGPKQLPTLYSYMSWIFLVYGTSNGLQIDIGDFSYAPTAPASSSLLILDLAGGW